MSSVMAGLHARREAIKRSIKQAIERANVPSSQNDEDEGDDPLWELQRQLESLHAQIGAYERAEAAGK
jgi:hypothetical protein